MTWLTEIGDTIYLEGIVRGYKLSMIPSHTYNDMCQSLTVEDLLLHLQGTSYAGVVEDLSPSSTTTTTTSSVISTSVLSKCLTTSSLLREFKYIRSNSTYPLSHLLDLITHHYMIDNVILLLTGTLRGRDTKDLIEQCHPLGVFDGMSALCVAGSVGELYDLVISESPLRVYFERCFPSSQIINNNNSTSGSNNAGINGSNSGGGGGGGFGDEIKVELIKQRLYKAYLEVFYEWCTDSSTTPLDSTSSQELANLLQFEADRRAISIVVNSINTTVSLKERCEMVPTFGLLGGGGSGGGSGGGEAVVRLCKAVDLEGVRAVCALFPGVYSQLFDSSSSSNTIISTTTSNNNTDALTSSSLTDKTIDAKLTLIETTLLKKTFTRTFNLATFYAYFKLKELEIRNIVWICECVLQGRRERGREYVGIF